MIWKSGSGPWRILVASLMLIAGGATAELQNVIINGTYSMKEESRVANVFPVALDDSGRTITHIRMETSEWSEQAYSAYLRKVAIPARLTPDSYREEARVFLSLYIGRPAGPAGEMDFAVTVSGYQPFVSTYRVYTGLVTEPGWHPIMIDMGPWAGQQVDLAFQAAWLEGDAQALIVGLPRLIASHGPASDGGGGLSMGPYYHGRGSLGSTGGPTFHLDGARMKGGPLAIACVDAIKISTVRLQSELQDYTATLSPGLHWLPLQLPVQSETKVTLGCIEGIVQRGFIDVIPNFMVNDKEILERLGPAATIPFSPQLFQVPTTATVAP